MCESKPLVSIIIPVRNRFRELKDALNSVFEQEYPVEVILVDDSDEPGLDILLSEFEKAITVIKNPTRLGIVRSRNVGLARAKGQYVCFLDSDDYWDSTFLRQSISSIERNGGVSATLCLSRAFFDPPFPFFLKLKIAVYILIKNTLILWNFFVGRRLARSAPFLGHLSHMVFRRKNLPQFDPQMNAAEDWKFIFDLMETQSVSIVPSALCRFRYNLTSNSFCVARQKATCKAEAYQSLIQEIEAAHPSSLYLKLFKIYTRHFVIPGA